MQFQYPATEVFNQQGGYTVAWSVEQYEKLLAEGWLAEKPVEPSPELLVEGTAKTKRGKGAIPSTAPEPEAT